MLQIKYIKSHCYYIFYGVICRRKGLTALLRSLDEKDMNYKHMPFRTQCGKSYERSQKCDVCLNLAFKYRPFHLEIKFFKPILALPRWHQKCSVPVPVSVLYIISVAKTVS